jgi:AraC-like DNA-binding protein
VRQGVRISDNQEARRSDASGAGRADDLTAQSLIKIDYIAPPAAVSELITILYHFRCDEPLIRDIQPASVGMLALFPHGKGHLRFANGRCDPNHEVALLTPLSAACHMEVQGPFHAIGASLSPLGWAALTGLNASEHGNRMYPAHSVLGQDIADLGAALIAAYRAGDMTGPDCAIRLADFIARAVRPVDPRHAALIGQINRWLGGSFNPVIGDLLACTDYSQRQVQRLCERYFGLPPKALARKYRALRAAALWGLPALSPEAEAELGEAFFDQSHMIREITHFVGRTPARLADKTTPYLAEIIDPKNLRELDG